MGEVIHLDDYRSHREGDRLTAALNNWTRASFYGPVAAGIAATQFWSIWFRLVNEDTKQ